MSDEPDPADGEAKAHQANPDERTVSVRVGAGSCRFLRVETTAHRAVVSGQHPAETYVVQRAWWCRHPFHGIELKIGLDVDEAVVQCRSCALPDHGAGPAT